MEAESLIRTAVGRKRFWLFMITSLLASLPLVAQTQESAAPKAQQSAITIKVFKSGLFSGFAHNHVVVAPIARAAIATAKPAAEITVVTKEMKVTDPEVSDKDRAEIQSTMLGPKVLDQEKYPEIHFRSSRIEQTSAQHYRVAGTLELHGAKQEITLEVTGGPEHFHGATKLKQSDYGIKPISLFGGSVKVKDELELEFDVYTPAPTAAGAPPAKKK
jgi:polyisoprenoid-binding protein YceI